MAPQAFPQEYRPQQPMAQPQPGFGSAPTLFPAFHPDNTPMQHFAGLVRPFCWPCRALSCSIWLRMLSSRPELTLVLYSLCLSGTACMLWHLHAVKVGGPGDASLNMRQSCMASAGPTQRWWTDSLA